MSDSIRNRMKNSRVGLRVATILAIPAVVLTVNAGAALANGGLAYQRR